jgi:hypothetical protein
MFTARNRRDCKGCERPPGCPIDTKYIVPFTDASSDPNPTMTIVGCVEA